MGKKGFLLDNGKKAQSSMALYWKAGREKSKEHHAHVEKPPKEQKQQDVENRVEQGKEKWKMHKEKLISKLYTKQEKKIPISKKQQEDKLAKQQEQIQRQLLQKQLTKNRPIKIPGFKGSSQLQKKMQFQQVKVGIQSNNKLVFPSGQEALTQQQIIQMLRQRKAKRQIQKKSKVQKIERVHVFHNDLLDIQQHKQPEKEKEPENKDENLDENVDKKPEEVTFFKSQILNKIQRGESLKKQQPTVAQPNPVQAQQVKQTVPITFVPRALWKK